MVCCCSVKSEDTCNRESGIQCCFLSLCRKLYTWTSLVLSQWSTAVLQFQVVLYWLMLHSQSICREDGKYEIRCYDYNNLFQRTGTSHHLRLLVQETILTFRISNICNRLYGQQATNKQIFVLPKLENQDAFIYVFSCNLGSTMRTVFYKVHTAYCYMQ